MARPEATGRKSGPDTFTDDNDNLIRGPPDLAARLLSRKQYVERLGICPRSALRLERSDPQFPAIIWRAGRAYVRDVDLDKYLEILVQRSLEGADRPNTVHLNRGKQHHLQSQAAK